MGRLAGLLGKANDAVAGVELEVEKDVYALIERTKEVHKKRETAFLKKHMNLDAQVTDLAEFAKDLDDFGKNDRSAAGGTSGGSAYTGTDGKKA